MSWESPSVKSTHVWAEPTIGSRLLSQQVYIYSHLCLCLTMVGIAIFEPFSGQISCFLWVCLREPTELGSIHLVTFSPSEHQSLHFEATVFGDCVSGYWRIVASSTATPFQAFFIPRGLPKLVIMDADSQFTSLVESMCSILGLPFAAVTSQPTEHTIRPFSSADQGCCPNHPTPSI